MNVDVILSKKLYFSATKQGHPRAVDEKIYNE